MSRYVLFSLIFSLIRSSDIRVRFSVRACYAHTRVLCKEPCKELCYAHTRVLCKERILFKNSFLQFSFHFFLSLSLSLSPRAKRHEEEEGNEREQSACASKGAAKSLSFSSEIFFSFFPNTKQQQNASL